MPICHESDKSPNLSKDGTIELVFVTEGTTDDKQAEALAFAKAPTTYRGLFRSGLPDTRCIGRGIFESTFTYKLNQDNDENEDEPTSDLPTIGKLSIEPVGGTTHITQCLYQIAYGNFAVPQVEQARVIGLHKDGVHGCDIDSAGSIITLQKLWLPQSITGNYIGKLDFLKNKTNLTPYTMKWALRGNLYQLDYESGSLRFVGAQLSTSITPKGITAWDISYKFIHFNNRRDVVLATGVEPITIKYIGGHDYVWTYYTTKEITGNLPATIEVPKMAFVSTVYEQAKFADYLGF